MKLLTESLRSLRQLGLLTAALTLALVANFAYGQWADPGSTYGPPPTSAGDANVPAPINVGSDTQLKEGKLGVEQLNVFNPNVPSLRMTNEDIAGENKHAKDQSYVFYTGNQGGLNLWHKSGTDPTTNWTSVLAVMASNNNNNFNYLTSYNEMRAPAYCNVDGTDCITIPKEGLPQGLPICADGQYLIAEDSDWVCETPTTPVPTDASGWYQTNTASCTTVCANQGLTADNRCLSGERRLKTTPTDPNTSLPIDYTYGTFGPKSSWGTQNSANYCYLNSQVLDNDDTDRTIACYCSTGSPSVYPDSPTPTPYTPPEHTTCFVAGTAVQMADGSSKSIEEVTIGERVVGADGVINTVLGYDRPMLGDRLLYSFNQGPFFVTAEHPFLTTDGWKSLSVPALIAEDPALAEQLSVTTLEVGDRIIKLDGSTELIESIDEQAAEDQQLYNLVLDGNHTYHADQYVTHNKGGDL